MTKEEFCWICGMDMDELESGCAAVYWKGSEVKELPEGLTLLSLTLVNAAIERLPEDLNCKGDIVLIGCDKLVSLPDSLKVVHGILNLVDCSSLTSLPDGLVVESDLYISHTRLRSLPRGLVVGGCLLADDTLLEAFPADALVGSLIDLSRCVHLRSLPDGMSVNGFLCLDNSGISSLPEHLTVKGNLDLMCTSVAHLPSTLRVGGKVSKYGSLLTDVSTVCHDIPEDLNELIWRDSNWVRYDEQLYEKVECHSDYWLVRSFDLRPDDEDDADYVQVESYIVTDHQGNYAHGYTLEDAWDDLNYKLARRDMSRYEGLTPDSELGYDEAVVCYRTVTGACRRGTEHFLKRVLKQKKEKYTIREMAVLTKGQFGNESFRDFFKIKESNGKE